MSMIHRKYQNQKFIYWMTDVSINDYLCDVAILSGDGGVHYFDHNRIWRWDTYATAYRNCVKQVYKTDDGRYWSRVRPEKFFNIDYSESQYFSERLIKKILGQLHDGDSIYQVYDIAQNTTYEMPYSQKRRKKPQIYYCPYCGRRIREEDEKEEE